MAKPHRGRNTWKSRGWIDFIAVRYRANRGVFNLCKRDTVYNLGAGGEEYQKIGVVNGLWEHDLDENRSRIEELLPDGSVYDADQAAELYQSRVGNKRGLFGASATEVVLLPEGWSYTTGSDIEGDNVVNIGDVVAIRAQKNRMVDYFTEIVRKCDQTPGGDERSEWDIGCQSISGFDEEGYGGNRHYWMGF